MEHHNQGLSNFAEQCGESIHAKFKPTWSRFKRQKEHPDYEERLLSAVVDFGAKRIRFCFNKFYFLLILKHVILKYSYSNNCILFRIR